MRIVHDVQSNVQAQVGAWSGTVLGPGFGPSSGPRPTATFRDPVLKLANQASHKIPALGAANFDVSLAIDPDDRGLGNIRLLKVFRRQFVVAHGFHQLSACHLNELHGLRTFGYVWA